MVKCRGENYFYFTVQMSSLSEIKQIKSWIWDPLSTVAIGNTIKYWTTESIAATTAAKNNDDNDSFDDDWIKGKTTTNVNTKKFPFIACFSTFTKPFDQLFLSDGLFPFG